MDTETTSQIYARVSLRRERFEENAEHFSEQDQREFEHLCEVEQALETVMGFLNGEHEAFKNKRRMSEGEIESLEAARNERDYQ